MVTLVPPVTGPLVREREVMVGPTAEAYVKCTPAAEVPPAVVAFTVTAPAPWAGEVTLIWEVLRKVTEPAGMVAPPNVTVVAPETNPLPVRVTVVPPATGPLAGEIPDTTGTAAVYL